jgi:hypothetical protein
MDLPREPTSLPQARRYQRTFAAPRSTAFGQEETFILNIPPIDRTYLAKNNKLHFDFNLEYTEASQATWQNIYADLIYDTSANATTGIFAASVPAAETATAQAWVNGFFNQGKSALINAYTKPMPTLDINGPYGLINRIRVYDYLGTTLLEDVQEHDVLTAMLTDFDMKNESFQLNRPERVDQFNQDTQQLVRKPPCSNLTPSDDLRKYNPASVVILPSFDGSLNQTGAQVFPIPIKVTTHMVMDLYSFLGKFSEKFVPLHNGFRLEFTVNKNTIPLAFATANGNLNVNYLTYRLRTTKSITLDPTINSMTLSNIYLKCDLLELSPELDKNTDKVVHYQGFKYQRDFFPYSDFTTAGVNLSDENRADFTKRVSANLKSVNKVFIGQRLVPTALWQQKLGFRVKNYLTRGELLFNRAIIQTLDNEHEAAQAMQDAMGTRMDEYLTMEDFNLEEPNALGTNGAQYNFIPFDKRQEINSYIQDNPQSTQWWNSFESGFITLSNNTGSANFTSQYSHGLTIGDSIIPISGAPTPINLGQTYYVVSVVNNTTVTLSQTIGGGSITPTNATGTNTPNIAANTLQVGMVCRYTRSVSTIPSTMDQGKFMLVFDTRLPGTSADTVGGIDIDKNMLEYKIVADSDICQKVYIDVITQHDTFLKIDPGKTSIVSF